jgi:hypothetical protein
VPKLVVACEGCGKELQRWPSAIREHVYCSQQCRTIRRKRICALEGCEREFIPRKWDIANRAAAYCSRRCAARAIQPHRQNGEVVTCPICGKPRYYSASKIAKGSRYCSSECFHLASRKAPAPKPRECLTCSKTFTPSFPAFSGARFCSRSCWGVYRWSQGVISEELLSGPRRGRGRQRWLGRWKGRQHGFLGGRKRIIVAEEQRIEIQKLASLGWGRRAIASRLLVSERAVRNVLEAQRTP